MRHISYHNSPKRKSVVQAARRLLKFFNQNGAELSSWNQLAKIPQQDLLNELECWKLFELEGDLYPVALARILAEIHKKVPFVFGHHLEKDILYRKYMQRNHYSTIGFLQFMHLGNDRNRRLKGQKNYVKNQQHRTHMREVLWKELCRLYFPASNILGPDFHFHLDPDRRLQTMRIICITCKQYGVTVQYLGPFSALWAIEEYPDLFGPSVRAFREHIDARNIFSTMDYACGCYGSNFMVQVVG